MLFSVGLLQHRVEKQAARCEALSLNKQRRGGYRGDYVAAQADITTRECEY